jgi:hypothetical protein
MGFPSAYPAKTGQIAYPPRLALFMPEIIRRLLDALVDCARSYTRRKLAYLNCRGDVGSTRLSAAGRFKAESLHWIEEKTRQPPCPL